MKGKLSQILFRPAPFKGGILCIVLCCLVWFSFGTEKPVVLEMVDGRILDLMFVYRGAEDSSGQVVIVDIDERSLKEYGQWPWSRNLVADLSDRIHEAKPRAVGFDIVFSEKDRTSPRLLLKHFNETLAHLHKPPEALEKIYQNPVFDYDTLLGVSIGRGTSVLGYSFLFREDFHKTENAIPSPSVILTLEPGDIAFKELDLITAYRPLLNIKEVSTGVSEGFFNIFPERDGIVRRVPLFILMDEKAYPSLAFEMLRVGTGKSQAKLLAARTNSQKKHPVKGVTVGDIFYKTDNYGQLAVNFRGPFNTFLYLSARDVLTGSEKNFLRNKYVLIGSSASGIINRVVTPFSARLPGVEVHANVLDNLLGNDAMVYDSQKEKLLTYLLIICGGLVITGSLSYLGPVIGSLATITVFFLIVIGNYFLLFKQFQLAGLSFILLSLLAVLISVTFCNYFFEGRRRLFIRRAFSHYVSPSVVNDLLKNPEKLDLLVDTREVTILFCDIRDFTSFAESTSVTELSRFLNHYFSLLTDIIIKHNGMVDKYMGDAIMAVWGTPLNDAHHAENAVQAALEMTQAIAGQTDKLQLAGKPIEIGIGINSGNVSAGNFGCSRRFDYTVLGDNVNLASRIEGLTKNYPVKILIAESTREKLPPQKTCRYIDSVLVKGRNEAVDLFEPISDMVPEYESVEIEQYLMAIKLYKKKRFEAAEDKFDNLYKSREDDLYLFYRDRCSHFILHPPAEGWSGVHVHT